ncbi:hypothetical protein BaRGS_00030357 [Batillaria attramentaria]|uniref:Uncharacterized protein n=1 Tax=Batillaria attramentaria TaxID=370345 RepID=A0ABD0JTS3_9CAEN
MTGDADRTPEIVQSVSVLLPPGDHKHRSPNHGNTSHTPLSSPRPGIPGRSEINPLSMADKITQFSPPPFRPERHVRQQGTHPSSFLLFLVYTFF